MLTSTVESSLFWVVQSSFVVCQEAEKFILMENEIDSLAKSSFTSPAQKTSEYHVLLNEEKHEKEKQKTHLCYED